MPFFWSQNGHFWPKVTKKNGTSSGQIKKGVAQLKKKWKMGHPSVHILKYSAMLLYKLLWTRQWAFWSLMLHIYIALIKQSSFQVEATLNSIRVFELFRSLAIQTRQKSPFWCLTQFVRAESRRVNLFEFSWEELSFWCLRRFVPPNNHWLHNSGRQSSLPSKSPSSKEYKQYLRIRTMVWLAPRGFKII